jgi:hypothetical protein
MPTSPATAGRTLCLVRHAARLDVLLRETNVHHSAVHACSRFCSDRTSSEDAALRQVLQERPWPDMGTRPYDTPIIDGGIAVKAAQEIVRSGLLRCERETCCGADTVCKR